MSDSRPVVAVVQVVHQPIGGVQTVMLQLLPCLTDQFRVVVIDPYQNQHFAAQCRTAGLDTATLGPAPPTPYIGGKGTWQRPWRLLRRAPWMALALVRFRRWVREQQVRIVWFNQLQTARYFGRALPRRDPALLYHAHGFASAAEIGPRTARWLSHRATAVIPVSRVTGKFLTDAGVDPARVHVVYNGIDLDHVRAASEQDSAPLPPKPAGAVVFAHVATLNRHKKAQHLAVAAMAQMKPRCGTGFPAGQSSPPAHLWICGDIGPDGDPSYRDELHRMVDELILRDRVHFLGWRRDIPRILAYADVAMLTSICPSESFGMVLVEAMALGKPCLATNIGGPPEIIAHGNTGLIADPTPDSLAAAMSTLAESPDLRAEMGAAARLRAESLFSLDRQAADFGAILRAACPTSG